MTLDVWSPFRLPECDSALKFSRRSFLWSSGAALCFSASRVRAAHLLTSPAVRPLLCLATSKTSYPPLLEKFIAKIDPASDIFPTEIYAEEIGKVLSAWSETIRHSARNSDAIRNALHEAVTASSLDPSEIRPLRSSGPLRVERRVFHGAKTNERSEFLTKWATYLSSFATLDVVELEIFGIHIASESPLHVNTEIRYDLVGKRRGWHARTASRLLDYLVDP